MANELLLKYGCIRNNRYLFRRRHCIGRRKNGGAAAPPFFTGPHFAWRKGEAVGTPAAHGAYIAGGNV